MLAMLEGFIFGIAIILCMGKKYNFTHCILILLLKLLISQIAIASYGIKNETLLYFGATVGYLILFVYKYFIMPRLK